MVVTDAGMVTVISGVPRNALVPMAVTLSGIVISVRPDWMKASLPIVVNPSGSVTFLRALQLLNALFSIVLMFEPKVTFERAEHPWNIPLIDDSPFPRVTFWREVQALKA